ncbi:microtubule-associated protein Jupiter-like [Tribolium madens]|uniref:microtubule-associated protein Jupiter-like n=1 Tax=Tribolium madens TaxID=41895 RepID=UPI001CF735C1|nr:microtubule-associated protein Jupiter-like [Tribolium madens]
MATYAAYRHIELDKVGYSKKRVRNPSSEIFNVLCTPPSNGNSPASKLTPRRSSHSDSFTRLFGTPEPKKVTPRRASLTKQDVINRNPVTGDGVASWDQKPANRNTPKVHNERNPVTGEVYTIVTPATTPTKPVENGFAHVNGTSTPMVNGNHEPMNGNVATE